MKRLVFAPDHGKRNRRRPRRCRACHAPATHATEQERPATSIKRDGTVTRWQEVVTVYWCADHTEVAL